MTPDPRIPVLVVGDVCLDVVGVPIPEKRSGPDSENWRQSGEMRTHFLPGGAMLLAEFIRARRLGEAAERINGEIAARKLTGDLALERRRASFKEARLQIEDEVAGPRPETPPEMAKGANDPLSNEEFLALAERLRRDEIVHSLISLAPFPTTAAKEDKSKTLRVDQVHGYSGPTRGDPSLAFKYPVGQKPRILVLDDTGNRFRTDVASNPWPEVVRQNGETGSAPLIIYKLHRPLPRPDNKNELWTEVTRHHPFNRLVVTSVDDIRQLGVPISLGLSWERTALDLVWHLLNVPALAKLRDCPRLIIRLGVSGALYWQFSPEKAVTDGKKTPESARAWLIYDPAEIEGSFTARFDHRGSMVAFGSAFTAALVQKIDEDAASIPDLLSEPQSAEIEPAVLAGIRAGLLASRRLLQCGFGIDFEKPSYPGAELFADPAKDDAAFACRTIPIIPGALQPDRAYWRLLDDIFADAAPELRIAVELTATARRPEKALRVDAPPALVGASDIEEKAAYLLSQVPQAAFADLRTYDRREIENYRALYSLIHDYIRLREPERPLSVAVFGPPGAGKSFGVKQVAKHLNQQSPKRPIVDLTFNLSQYQTSDQLAAAFHLVRDLVLQGKIPLVFFDEFDTALNSQKLGWLRYFLAPMQDGMFLDRGALHPIGQAIFIFAGGTCDTYDDFAQNPSDQWSEEFKAAKGPDFLSRLRGALDVPSLNFTQPQEPRDPPTPNTFDPHGPAEALPCEAAILLRRAGVLAYQLGRKAPALKDAKGAFRVRPEVLRAFLYIPIFRHGNRSLEALLDMSRLYGNSVYVPSLLPSPGNADMHADAGHLAQLIGTGYPFPDRDRDIIARSIHRTYLASNPPSPDPSALLDWDDPKLPNHLKQTNLEQADHIAAKLRFVGLWFRKTPRNSPPPDFDRMNRLITEHLVPLAMFEHDRWVAQKRRQGWAPGPDNTPSSKIPGLKLHNCLFSWNKLTAEQQKLDYDTIRAIPIHLAAAGYEIVKLSSNAAKSP